MKMNFWNDETYYAQGDIVKQIDSGESLDEWILCGKESDQHPAHGEDVWLCFDWYPNKVGSYFNDGKKPERRIEKARWFLTYWEVNGCKAENISPIAWTRCTNEKCPKYSEDDPRFTPNYLNEGVIRMIKLPDGKNYRIAGGEDKTPDNGVKLFADDKEILGVASTPPLGITPRWIHDKKRMREILDGMERYSKEQKVIPVNWIKEAREIFTYLMSKKGYENG